MCVHILHNSLVAAKIKVSIFKVHVNNTLPEFIVFNRVEVTPQSLVFIEANLLKEISSMFVRYGNFQHYGYKIDQLIVLQGTLSIYYRNNGQTRQLISTKNSQYDLCALTKKSKKFKTSIVESIYFNVLKFSNLPQTGCPFPPDKYLLNAFQVDAILPPLVPSGVYVAHLNLFTLDNQVNIKFLQMNVESRVENL